MSFASPKVRSRAQTKAQGYAWESIPLAHPCAYCIESIILCSSGFVKKNVDDNSRSDVRNHSSSNHVSNLLIILASLLCPWYKFVHQKEIENADLHFPSDWLPSFLAFLVSSENTSTVSWIKWAEKRSPTSGESSPAPGNVRRGYPILSLSWTCKGSWMWKSRSVHLPHG